MARTLIISYDLSKPGQNYEPLIQRIKKYESWARLGGSAYLIYTAEETKSVRDTLWALMDKNDKLFVGIAPPPSAWGGLTSEVSNWILKHQTQ